MAVSASQTSDSSRSVRAQERVASSGATLRARARRAPAPAGRLGTERFERVEAEVEAPARLPTVWMEIVNNRLYPASFATVEAFASSPRLS